MGDALFRSSSLVNFDLCECFLAHSFTRKQEDICSHQKLAHRSDLWVPPVRPVWAKSIKCNLDFTVG
jgi:hypothetical protein